MPASEKEYLIEFDSEKCTQCHGCEIACKAWRELSYAIQYRRVLNLWQGEYPRVKSASLSLACLHCVEPLCAAACPEDAISKGSIRNYLTEKDVKNGKSIDIQNQLI
jgi:anaerobic dimethyl sulfoxide reductase subunit B (iron-sulfur subunit)